MKIKTILVDDETLAIQGLELRLQNHPDIDIIDRCRNGREAIRSIRVNKPDLVFLDIQMPGFDGFGVIEGLMDIEPPLFVFVTAHNEFAIKAFEAQALDYLLKPVEGQRLSVALDRVRARMTQRSAVEQATQLRSLLKTVAPDSVPRNGDETSVSRFERMINIKDRGQIFRVDVESIERIDAAGDYMCINTGSQTLILRETMKDLEKRLDPRKFRRIHRSTIVNLDQVRQVKPHTNGECFLVLGSGSQVKVSRSYRDVVARFL